MAQEPKIVVDFSRRETEAGWNDIFDKFGLQGTPLWFSWLEWILALGAFQFLYEKTHSYAVLVLIILSGAILWNHFIAVFYRIEFRGIPFLRSERSQRITSLVISAVLAFFAFRLATTIPTALASLQQEPMNKPGTVTAPTIESPATTNRARGS